MIELRRRQEYFMSIIGWKYYNHAALPTCAPHEVPDLSVIKNGEVWRSECLGGKALLARWTTDWDCGHKTNFWYIIKDTPFDISLLKKKRRYEINKGKKYFRVAEIDPLDYTQEIYAVQCAAYESYPKKYRPNITLAQVKNDLASWKSSITKVYGAFDLETEILRGYIVLRKTHDKHISFSMLRVMPKYEANGVNAALISYMLEDHQDFLASGGYICDGARNILHETNFQDYLEKYFGFRKAYCRLHVLYNLKIRVLVSMLYPFRKILKAFDGISLFHKINGFLFMESILRKDQSAADVVNK